MTEFHLDAKIAADSTPVVGLGFSDLRLMNDARYPWLILVPRTAAVEIVDLDPAERTRLLDEISQVSAALRQVTRCDKLNIAALGNVVRQLHVHVIGRFETDAAWPRPVWGFGEAVAYGRTERDSLIGRIRAALPA